MALYLLHKTLNGEPIGIFSETGEDFYFPDYEDKEKAGRASVPRTFTKPWNVFVEEKTRSFNHRFLWGSVEDERTDLEDVLLDQRTKFRDG